MSSWTALIFNALLSVLGVAQGADWVQLLGSSQAGIIIALLAGANAALHALAVTKAPGAAITKGHSDQ